MQPWNNKRCYPVILLENLRKTMRNLMGQVIFQLSCEPGSSVIQVRRIIACVNLLLKRMICYYCRNISRYMFCIKECYNQVTLSVKLIFKPVLTVHHVGILSVVISIFTIETMKYICVCVCVFAHAHTHTHTHIHIYFRAVLVAIMHVKCKEGML